MLRPTTYPILRRTAAIAVLLLMLCSVTGVHAQKPGWQPSNMTTTVEYDPNDNSYVKITKVGDMVVDR